jgi:opacity protein-like surface antigen
LGGFGYGVGSADFTGAGGYRHDGKTGVTPQFRFGRMLVKQRLLVSVQINQWVAESGGLPEVPADPGTEFVKFQVNSQLVSLGVTAYPGNPNSALGGLSLSAGGGPAVGRVDVAQAPLTGTGGEDPDEVVNYDWGWGFYVGAGYEWRVFRSVAAGATIQYYHTANDGDLIDTSNVLPVSLSLNWYF